ncbi:hypothetical protein BKA70DRAFT_1451692 [Coprinopsis sp. MPI-PUGE-AT-0042]|nr:hypothetical protein BKA70DRAFT_1451692 [Coprinopsis sp. MPI-PUGE-AT-0042]
MHALATGTWGDPQQNQGRSLPPFEGYHIVYDRSVDSTAIPLSEAMMSKASPASTTTSSSTNSYSPAPSSISSLTSSRLHFPSIPSGRSILSNTPSVADTGVDQLPDAPSLLASRHAKGKMASRPGVTTPPPREEDPVMRHRIPDIFLRGSSKDRTAIHPRPQPRLKPSDLPPSRRVTSEDKYYVVQVGLEPGVYKGETEARKRMGASRLAFTHVEGTKKAAKARYRSLSGEKGGF